MSIVAAPRFRLAQAALWNGQPPQRTTGVARLSASHCQFSNWKAGTIEITRTGSDSTADTIRRTRSGSAGSGASSPAGGPAAGSCAL